MNVAHVSILLRPKHIGRFYTFVVVTVTVFCANNFHVMQYFVYCIRYTMGSQIRLKQGPKAMLKHTLLKKKLLTWLLSSQASLTNMVLLNPSMAK